MKNKQYIYRWLFLPLIACIMAGTTGCGSDMTEESGKPSPDGGTYLTVTARGITETPTDGNYDDYIASLRILAFDENGWMLCNTLYKGSEGNGAKQWIATDDAITIKEKIGNGGGKYSFYFIANEETYNTMDGGKSLNEKLNGIRKKNDLKEVEISFTSAEISGGRALLMTAVEEDYPIIAGKDNLNMVVYLERVLAKARIQVINQSAQTTSNFDVSNVRLTGGQIPSSYTLLTGETRKTKYFLEEETDMSGNMTGNTYTSKTIYMPERILDNPNDESGALKISLDVTIDGQSKSYELPIGNGKQTPVNYDINRNSDYTTTGFIKEWGTPIIIHATVAPWEVQDETREWLGAAEVEFEPNTGSNKKNSKGELYVVYDETKPVTVTFGITVTAPLGNTWKVVCSNPAQFEATINNGTDGGIINEDKNQYIITIKAKGSYPTTGEKPQTDFYVTFSNGEYVTDMVIRQGNSPNFNDGYSGGTQTRFVIVQEQTDIN